MFNRRLSLIAAGLSASIVGVASALAARGEMFANRVHGAENIRAVIKHARKGRVYRSRGPQAKPKKHRNLQHVSKRVRRKHRRAA